MRDSVERSADGSRSSYEQAEVRKWIYPEKLWADRVSSYWLSIIPYIGYVIRSGFGFMVAFLFVVGTALYASYLERVPADFPVRLLALVILVSTLVQMTYRTFIVEADRVFFLRIAHNMQPYLRRSVRYSLIPRLLLTAAVWTVIWPLYQRVDVSPKPYLLMLIVLFILKLVVAYGVWVERHVTDKDSLFWLDWSRKIVCVLFIWAWLWFPIPAAGLFSGVIGIVYLLALRHVPVLTFAWDAHMEAERVHQQRIQQFLSSFVDLPAMDERRYARPWLSWLGNRYSFRQPYAYHYMLAKTIIRSEWLGIWMRLTIIGTLLITFAKDTPWNGLLLLLFLVAIGAQNRTLFQLHKHDVWYQLYPLSPKAKKDAALTYSTAFHFLSALILLVPVIVGATSIMYRLAAVGLAAVIVASTRWSRGRSKLQDEDDDD
ncbi:ABC transporter permease [Paenibacillus assamensis]|uniref:ABC transporter permease n=1 Tax=Paenibacillus assamensis TaxID=311244 RepID=UPI0003F5B6F7|nr:ABC transporter permease [Paenibacillus assamensis]